MRVNSNFPFNKSVRSTSENQAIGENKRAFLKKTEETSRSHSTPVDGQLISKQELLALAADIKSGSLNRAEANHRFINVIVDNCLHGKLGEKDRKKLVSDISDLFSGDVEFQKQLEKSLNELA